MERLGLCIKTLEYPKDIDMCHEIRRRVFIVEQDVRVAEEIDGLDGECVHFLAERDGIALGTARLRSEGDVAKVERVAVLAEHRGRGIGRALMVEIEGAALARGYRELLLGAQLRAIPFYESLGYVVEGDEYLDARIRHRWMRKTL